VERPATCHIARLLIEKMADCLNSMTRDSSGKSQMTFQQRIAMERRRLDQEPSLP